MVLGAEKHHVALYDRGGVTSLGFLDNVSLVRWTRVRDDISEAQVNLVRPSVECQEILKLAEANRTEMVIFRGSERVWEGPITLIRDTNDMERVVLQAKDILHYVYRTNMQFEHDNRYPNTTTVVARFAQIINEEFARKEALDPPYNVLPYLTAIEGPEGARTAAKTEPYEYTLFEHMDSVAARAGLEYTVVGRRLILFDGSALVGQAPVVTRNDIVGDVISTTYGMEGATLSAVTDGAGTVGIVGSVDGYYGLIEILDSAYDEEAADGAPPEAIPVSELRSQAQRNIAGRNPTPLLVRIPDGSTINPAGVLEMEHLVPGVWVPLQGSHLGRPIRQMMRFNDVRFEWSPDKGETIQATLGPRPGRGGGTEIDPEEM